jgi:hypothetical protein
MPGRKKKSAKNTASRTYEGFTEEERGTMKQRAKELKAAKADVESDMLAKIAEIPEPDRVMAERLHALIKASAPALAPNFGRDARVRQGRLGCLLLPTRAEVQVEVSDVRLQRRANLDEGAIWPTAFALT